MTQSAAGPGLPTGTARLASLQAGRGLAAFYVLLFHAEVILRLSFPEAAQAPVFFAGGHAGVQFFFVLSGFIMGHIHRNDLGRAGAFQPYLVARFIRIYPPFWCVLAALVAMQIVMGRLEPVLQGNPLAWVQALLLFPFEGAPPLTAAWTLSHEILFYLMFGLCILLGRAGMLVFAVWMLACLGSFVLSDASAFPLSFLVSTNNLLFGIGLLAAFLFGTGSIAGNRLVLAVGGVFFLLTTFLGDAVPEKWQIILYGLASGLVIHGAANLELRQSLTVPPLLERLGDASYSIYLAHGPAMAFVAILLARVEVARAWPPVLQTLILVIVGLIVGIAFHLIAERPLLDRLRRLTRPGLPLRPRQPELP